MGIPTRVDNSSRPDYAVVTERPGDQVTAEAVRMFQTRYGFARQFCERKDVLELGCGAGLGLAFLAKYARSVLGGDYSSSLLKNASQASGGMQLVCLDAHTLPFQARSFDVILLFEAIYYLHNPHEVLAECKRVLRAGGTLIVCLANREWPGFNPSPFSFRYFSATELYDLFAKHNLEAQVFGGFRSRPSTVREKIRDWVRRMAVRGHLIPMSFKAKARLKKFFYGRLQTMGTIEESQMQLSPLFPVGPGDPHQEYRVLYAVGHLSAMSTACDSSSRLGSHPCAEASV